VTARWTPPAGQRHLEIGGEADLPVVAHKERLARLDGLCCYEKALKADDLTDGLS
jgi:hypothetical protein